MTSPLSPLLASMKSAIPAWQRSQHRRKWTFGIVAISFIVVVWLAMPLYEKPVRKGIELYRTREALNEYETLLYSIAPESAYAKESDDPLPSSSYLEGKRVLIIQHNNRATYLERASERTHAAYAAAWGYGHLTVPGNHCPEGVHGTLNKQYVIVPALKRELALKKTEYEWILYTDADTLVLNPTLPVHAMLPPASYPPVNTMGNEDHNGLNAGVIMFRVNQDSLDLLEATIKAAEDGVKFGAPNNNDRNDQTLMNNQFRWFEKYGEKFVRIPQLWLNAYNRESYKWDEGTYQIQFHLVHMLKHSVVWLLTIQDAVNSVKEALAAGGLDKLHADDFAQAAELYWNNTKPGIEGFHFFHFGETIEGSAYGEAEAY